MIKRLNKPLLLSVLGSSLLLSGCGLTSSSVDKNMQAEANNTHLTIVDQSLYSALEAKFYQPFKPGLSAISVPMTNRYRQPLTFQYRFYWFDQEGLEIDPEQSAWIDRSIGENETFVLTQAVPDDAVQSYRLVLRLKPTTDK